MRRKLLLLGSILIVGALISLWLPDAPAYNPATPWHHSADGYRNLPGSPRRKSSLANMKTLSLMIFRSLSYSLNNDRIAAVSSENHFIDSRASQLALRATTGDSLTWLGHMSALLRLDGVQILLDPVFAQRASPLSWAGPARRTPLPFGLDDLPPPDLILITHNHFDHLDVASLEQLPMPERTTVIVPLGVGHYLRHIPFGRLLELDWHQHADIGALRVYALPVVHWSRRTGTDENRSLWASFRIEHLTSGRSLWYGEGDYAPLYRDIRKRYGPVDIALIAAGAYLPRELMTGSHCSPANCVRIGRDLGAGRLIPLHWATFQLGLDDTFATGASFADAARRVGVERETIHIMRIGETVNLPR